MGALVVLIVFASCAAPPPAASKQTSGLVQLPPGMRRYEFLYFADSLKEPSASWTIEFDPDGRAVLHAFGIGRPNGTYEASISVEPLARIAAELDELGRLEQSVCVGQGPSFTVRDRMTRTNFTGCLPTIRPAPLAHLYDLAVTLMEEASWSLPSS